MKNWSSCTADVTYFKPWSRVGAELLGWERFVRELVLGSFWVNCLERGRWADNIDRDVQVLGFDGHGQDRIWDRERDRER